MEDFVQIWIQDCLLLQNLYGNLGSTVYGLHVEFLSFSGLILCGMVFECCQSMIFTTSIIIIIIIGFHIYFSR